MAVDRARALEVIRLVRAEGNQHVSRRGYERWRVAQAEPGDWPTAAEIVGAFDGRWGHALRAAGLEVVRGPRKTVTDGELLGLIGRCAVEVGQVPTQAVYGGWAVGQDPPGPSGSTVSLRFGSWTAALRLAGLDPALARRRVGAVTGSTPERRAEVVAALRAFAVDVGVAGGDAARSWETFRALGPAAYAAWREERALSAPSSVMVRACASPWIAALQLAGLASAARVPRKPLVFTDDVMLRALRDAAAALPEGVGLSNLRYQAWRGDRDDVPTSRLVWERFGSWAAALTAAGIRAAPPAVDGEELLAALRRFLAETLGEPHRDRYLLWAADERRAPPVGAFTIAFGSWSAAIATAGGPVGVRNSRGPDWENQELLDALLRWAADPVTEPPLISPRYRAWAFEQDELLPTDAVIATRFGSWTAAMQRAGLESDEQVRDRFRELEPDATERAFRGFVDAVPDPVRWSQYRYSRWRAGNAPWAPSTRTLSVRFGGWAGVRAAIATTIAEQGPAAGDS